jgi:chitodextrinase
LDVVFSNQSTGDYTERRWEFGDGTTNDSRDYITHTYNSPGTYSIELTVTGPSGSDVRTETAYITVGDTTPPLLAEFSGDSQEGLIPLEAGFEDQSSGDIVSWFWDFGDGQVSMEQNPIHTYATEGNYTVSLTVNDSGGHSATEVKENFVLARIYDKSIDNVDYPKKHYRKKTILFRKALEMDKSEFRYARMFYSSCNSGNYYMDTFNRGIMFYTLNTASGRIDLYLQAYLEGKSDQEIWEKLQKYEPIYDYYNFNRYPWGQ